ncbi:hypothetical protein GMMP15_1260001 [Candidatus Magnetomoraceae bacterium gMMP-15]
MIWIDRMMSQDNKNNQKLLYQVRNTMSLKHHLIYTEIA